MIKRILNANIRCMALLLAVAAVASGCGRSGDSKGAGATGSGAAKSGAGSVADSAGAPPVVTAAWTKAGLTVSAFTKDQSGAVGSDCQSGTVSGLDVVVCKFASDQAAKAAEANGLTWIGDATGAAVASHSNLLAVVDRRKADPSGRTINQILKLFNAPAASK